MLYKIDKELIEYKNRVEVEECVIYFENYIRVLIEENVQQIINIGDILNNYGCIPQ